MAMRMGKLAWSGVVGAAIALGGVAFGQSSSGTMGTNSSVRNESTMGGQNTNSGVEAGGMNQGSLNQGSMQAGTGTPQEQGHMAGGKHRGNMDNPDAQLAQLSRRYHLTSQQQSQVKPILQDLHQQVAKIRGNSNMSQADKHTNIEAAYMNSQFEIGNLLKGKQKEQFEADQKQMQQRRQARRRQQDAGAMNRNAGEPQGNGDAKRPQSEQPEP
jgi:hypothetical protein